MRSTSFQGCFTLLYELIVLWNRSWFILFLALAEGETRDARPTKPRLFRSECLASAGCFLFLLHPPPSSSSSSVANVQEKIDGSGPPFLLIRRVTTIIRFVSTPPTPPGFASPISLSSLFQPSTGKRFGVWISPEGGCSRVPCSFHPPARPPAMVSERAFKRHFLAASQQQAASPRRH